MFDNFYRIQQYMSIKLFSFIIPKLTNEGCDNTSVLKSMHKTRPAAHMVGSWGRHTSWLARVSQGKALQREHTEVRERSKCNKHVMVG